MTLFSSKPANSLLYPAYQFLTQLRNSGSGRWYPQPFNEMSRHRTRPPTYGIQRRTELVCIDNSEIGKDANMSGRLAYCIWVYKRGYRKRHMPKAELGDKILVAIRGEMRRAIVVGATQHAFIRKHGIPSTDTNNIVLLDDKENPIGNRVLGPMPSYLMRLREKQPILQKVCALGKKFF
ncbi:unnamed protein product [Meloidogyne enterolobii]|uniref:Uncharacterized protein n=1 Tax=Meloidogyne enterolobii TaxID=390850 RepID=A0ACB1ABF0_MELEN